MQNDEQPDDRRSTPFIVHRSSFIVP
jgi:hypothetical protein